MWPPGERGEVREAQLQGHAAGRVAALPAARAPPARPGPRSVAARRSDVAMVAPEGLLRAHRLRRRERLDRAVVEAEREVVEPAPARPEARLQLRRRATAASCPMVVTPMRLEPSAVTLPTPQRRETGSGGEEVGLGARPAPRRARRACGGRRPPWPRTCWPPPRPTRSAGGLAIRALIVARDGAAVARERLGAGDVEEGLVDGDRLQQRRERRPGWP